MVRRLIPFFTALVLSACASAPEKKLSASEAFGIPALPVLKLQPKKRQAPLPNTAELSPELNAALVRFAHAARLQRTMVEPGASMPSGAVKNWLILNGAVDAFLRKPPGQSSSFDIIRARVTVEAELELDARAYGDIPPDLADGILERVGLLATRMAQVRRLHVVTHQKKSLLLWPVEPAIVTSVFGRRLHPIAGTWKQHFGIDLAADEGQLISAAAEGVVLRSGPNGAHGIHVELQHKGGLVTRYSHLSQSLVEPGSIIKKGDPVGLAGSTGAATGAHLHFEIWRAGNAVDPLEELGRPLPEADSMAAL